MCPWRDGQEQNEWHHQQITNHPLKLGQGHNWITAGGTHLYCWINKKAIGTKLPITFYPINWHDQLPVIKSINLINVKMLEATCIHWSVFRWFEFFPMGGLPDLWNWSCGFFRIELKVFDNLWIGNILDLKLAWKQDIRWVSIHTLATDSRTSLT